MGKIILLLISVIVLMGFVYADCVVPYDGMVITQDTIFCQGTYDILQSINISQSNIVLDCDGAVLIGNMPVNNNTGIYAGAIMGLTNITIRNCNVTNFIFGLYIDHVYDSFITNNIMHSNIVGVYIRASDSILSDNTANSNNIGISIGSSDTNNNQIINNIANSNSYSGIISTLGSHNIFKNNIANSNYYGGIVLQDSSYNILENNIANSNYATGILLNYGSYYTQIKNNTANSNYYGITITGAYNVLLDNTANSNSYSGIYITRSSSNQIMHNTANSNIGYGILLASSPNNVLLDNTANSNGRGFFLYSSSDNIFVDSNLFGNLVFDTHLKSNSENNQFINVSYSEEYVENGSSLIREWYLDTQVNDSLGYLENAEVNISNSTGDTIWSELSDAEGIISRQILTEYIDNGERTYQSPYTISISKTGYITNSTIYNLSTTGNVNHFVNLIPSIIDSDNDGVPDSEDKCQNTQLPETFESFLMKTNRYGEVDGDKIFETARKINKTNTIIDSKYFITDTYGCSCKQILNLKPGKNKGELKYGCSDGTMKDFIKKRGWARKLFN